MSQVAEGAEGSAYSPQASTMTCPGSGGAVLYPPNIRTSSESGQALKSPVLTGGNAEAARGSAINRARTETWRQRSAEASGAGARGAGRNGTGVPGDTSGRGSASLQRPSLMPS